MSPSEFTIHRTFGVARAVVWQAWTDPTIAARWWHPHEVTTKEGSVHIDLREGGEYSYTMVDPDGVEYPTGGTYLEVRAPERLRFTWADPGDPQPERPIITVDLAEPEPDTCELTFHFVLHGLDEHDDGSGIEEGWSQALAVLTTVVESR